jgi:hypothetical protein
MPRSTLIESAEIRLVNGLIHYVCTSGDDVLRSCMPRSVAVRAARDILAAVEKADMADIGGEVVPFRGTG